MSSLMLASAPIIGQLACMVGGDCSGGAGLIVALSELAVRVQRGRTTDAVLRIAAEGVQLLGMRFLAFQIDGDDLVLRHLATAGQRHEAIERMLGRPLIGLRAPLARCGRAAQIVAGRQNFYSQELDVFVRFIEAATGRDPLPLDATPATAGMSNGVVAPIFVREEPWGLLSLVHPTCGPDDAAAVALFATHVGSAIEVAEFIQALERTQEELIARERLATIGELAAIVAHEVRNPLGVLFNSVASLRRILRDDATGSPREDAEVLLTIVSEEAERLNAIVSDILEFARPRAMRTRKASLTILIRDVVCAVTLMPGAPKVEVRLDLCPDLPAVEIDARLVRQALHNLVLNALQAMPNGGALTVRTRRQQRDDACFACVDVTDTGDGIAIEDRGRVLEPFFTTKATGTGLGLPLVKRVIEAHQGELTIKSAASGTTFTLRLPLSRRQSPAFPMAPGLSSGSVDRPPTAITSSRGEGWRRTSSEKR